MKRIILLNIVLLILGVSLVNAHPPAKFNYQGVARTAAGLPIANQRITLRISIIDVVTTPTPSTTVVYTETHVDTTNAFGLYNIAVGGGVVVTGTIQDVNWSFGEKYLQVEMDPAGGTAYVMLGKSRLQSVPFARRAEDAGMISMYGGNELLGANPSKMIIRHSIKNPTWGLFYNDAESQFNFIKAGVSIMDVDFGLNKININAGLKIAGGTPAVGKVLTSDSTGIATWQDFGTKVSSFQPTGCKTLTTVTSSYQKIADMGTFTKTLANTLAKLTLQTNMYVDSMGTGGVIFELRIDGNATTLGNATATIKSVTSAEPTTITGIYKGLTTGTHSVSLWVKTTNGSAKNAGYDKGCLNTFGTNNVLIEEYK
ncbi:MAG: hypothetical protein ABI315_05825 [Bacteroidia bacterium]